MELRSRTAEYCADLLGIKCGAEQVMLGGKHSDMMLCIAFAYGLEAEKTAEIILRNSDCFMLFNVNVIQGVCAEKGYINIRLSDEFLECIADKIIMTMPSPQVMIENDGGYAVARAYMMSRKSNDFSKWIVKPLWRRAFLTALNSCGNPKRRNIAVKAFLAADKSECCYDGIGKLADALSKLLYTE